MSAPGKIALADLVRDLPRTTIVGDHGSAVSGIAYDSRKVVPGDLFAAIPGTRTDGARFIPEALEAGAKAVLAKNADGQLPVPVLVAPDVRLAMGMIAARLYQHPDHELDIIGITGTNGKTTTSYLLEAILEEAGKKPGVIGTINYRLASSERPAPTTTPESVDIFEIISEMREQGATHLIMEISSHALDQKRVSGLRIGYGLFTNLSRDHLDYHNDLEDYYQAKKKLFSEVITGSWAEDLTESDLRPLAVVNLDDPSGARLAGELAEQNVPCKTYGIESLEAQVRATDISISESGLSTTIETPETQIKITSSLIGAHNVQNILAAITVALEMGIGPEVVRAGIASLDKVPGRLEPVINDADMTVLVDYAHTPDALAHAVDTCKALARKKLITVFGCGGDRDPGKRPQMGRVAISGSDICLVTSDNPRTEDPAAIIDQILEGMKGVRAAQIDPETAANGRLKNKSFIVEPDRKKAIKLAIALGTPGDVVLIAGKGHEDYQILGTKKIHFDDIEEAKSALMGERKT